MQNSGTLLVDADDDFDDEDDDDDDDDDEEDNEDAMHQDISGLPPATSSAMDIEFDWTVPVAGGNENQAHNVDL
jgi:hypothetical protein